VPDREFCGRSFFITWHAVDGRRETPKAIEKAGGFGAGGGLWVTTSIRVGLIERFLLCNSVRVHEPS
jgi:hypothetical protein